ncbi:DJ-1 [Pterulicium gracile]|uniref:D-lactate dehydratase n=1 Tax=Pterulicium gracile TaxID=1884261 RepID=A0A5C3QC31_9AGAR|nr:DJ-1 [Pterula gracilis]
MTSALILIANGTEEMEFTITYDTLVRGGVSCTSAFVPDSESSPGENKAKCSRGLVVTPDTILASVENSAVADYDLLVIPGGAKGAETMSGSAVVQALVRDFLYKQKYVGMICAGSLAAKTAKLPRQPLTSHPSVKEALEQDFEYSEDPVVLSGKLITSRGPGTAFPFALTLVELLCGKEARDSVYGPMVFPPGTPW